MRQQFFEIDGSNTPTLRGEKKLKMTKTKTLNQSEMSFALQKSIDSQKDKKVEKKKSTKNLTQ